MKLRLLFWSIILFQANVIIGQTTYIENFDKLGYPTNTPNGAYWNFFNEIYPSQDIWSKFIPGDGFAYISVDADIYNDTDPVYPYQTIVFGGIGENHRLEVRMKGAVVDGGLVAFLFTYTQTGSIFNEVDIEVVAQDRNADNHEVSQPNGWTDARFNTWRNADENTALPFSGSEKAVVDASNNKISLMDDQFHTYTIDWGTDKVDFLIDGILQESFSSNIATGWAEVIIGYRNLPWAGDFNWSGTHTLVIDYFKIEPLEPPLSNDSHISDSEISVYPNPTSDFINISIPENNEVKKIELINMLSSTIIEVKNYQKKIDISNYSKGMYFLKIELENGSLITKKIMKL